jgi:DNA-binding transcriptional regulator YhcF (GntR family)
VGRSAKSYRELGRKIQIHHNTVKKYLTKMEVRRKAKESAPETTARQQFVIKAGLKLLTQNFFSAKSIYKCVMEDESQDHPASEDVKFIARPSSQRRICCGWLTVKVA